MSKKIKWIDVNQLPPAVQYMLARFEAVFSYGRSAYDITHYRDDAVFVLVNGMADAYLVARFIQQVPDVYIELDATAPSYWTLRMFNSQWLRAHELRRKMSWIGMAVDVQPLADSVRVRQDAIREEPCRI